MNTNSCVQKIVLSDNVQKCIEQVLQNQDPLNAADFDSTDYINQLFPNEQSLSNIDDIINKMELQISELDDNIRGVVRSQSQTGEQGKQALQEAQTTIVQLFSQITDIKERAEKTELMVKEITADIKQLDCAKKNLTSAITILNHLHMLFGGVESLVTLAENRQYGEILNPLQAITEVNEYFKQYTEIPHIQSLSQRVTQIHTELASQITEDFKNCFSTNNTATNNANKMSMKQLTDACKVLSVLDPKVKRELLKWYVTLQLEEYVQLFHENQDIAWLDKIDKRYAWIKRKLLDFEDKYGKIFPMDWEVSERIAVHFCNITREELSNIMNKRRTEIDVKLLLFAIQKTSTFEILLVKRFSGATFDDKFSPSHSSIEKNPSMANKNLLENEAVILSQEQIHNELEKIQSPFVNLIGICFKAYLNLYTESIDRNLAELVEKFVREYQKDITDINAGVFPSCADLFVFYKKCMVQCTQLSSGKTMFELATVFKKYLREYAAKILESRIPKLTSVQPTIGTNLSFLTKDLQNLPTAAGQVIHNFLKEGETPRYTKDEVIRICCIMTTAEYCLETVEQLEDKLKEKIEPIFKDKIDLSEEKDIFHRVISNSIHLLVQDVESGCEPAMIAMSKVQWQNISQVGDQSPFVNSIITHFKQSIPIIRDNLSTSRKYYTQFCHKFVNSFIPKYINTLYKCRPTNDTTSNIMGCEQLLLDTHSLKTTLLDLPSIGSQVVRKAPTSYTKVVVKGMSKAEMIIKIVMAPVSPVQQFIEQYLKILPESSLGEFYKVLEMKSLKKQDQLSLIDLYKKLAPKENLIGDTEDSSNISTVSDSEKGKSLKKFENLLRKRFP
uniref:Vacuolar protein sorting-associated protein 53 homolog n=1 Tax=Culicoides sonorensis TaxID=179676 RepID=A0A336KA85_CULSO